MRFSFHEEAEAELDQTVGYYEDCLPELGLDFAGEIYAAIDRITQFPKAWSLISRRTRRCLVNRFPFGVIYQVKSNHVRILAVADLRRRPGYWRGRK